jgi:hypothetical protein
MLLPVLRAYVTVDRYRDDGFGARGRLFCPCARASRGGRGKFAQQMQ